MKATDTSVNMNSPDKFLAISKNSKLVMKGSVPSGLIDHKPNLSSRTEDLTVNFNLVTFRNLALEKTIRQANKSQSFNKTFCRKGKSGIQNISSNVIGYLNNFLDPKDLMNVSTLNRKFFNKIKNEQAYKLLMSIVNKKLTLEDLLLNDGALLALYVSRISSSDENGLTIEYVNKLIGFILNYCLKSTKFCLKIQKNIMTRGFTYLTMADLTKYVQIDLSTNKIGDEGIEKLSKIIPFMDKLEYLNISMNQISSSGFIKIFESLKQAKSITELNASGNSLKDSGMKGVASFLEASLTIQTLNISYNAIEDEGIELLAEGIINNRSLKSVDVGSNKFTGQSLTHLLKIFKRYPIREDLSQSIHTSLPPANTLSSVGKGCDALLFKLNSAIYEERISKASESAKKLMFISENQLPNQKMKGIEQNYMSSFNKIESLNLSANKLNFEDINFLLTSISNTELYMNSLTRFNLSKSYLLSCNFPALSKFIETSNIKELILKGNNFSQNTPYIEAFSYALQHNSFLIKLNLENCKIGDQLASKILKHLPRTAIKELNFNSNDLSHNSLRQLADSLGDSQLLSLFISSNTFGNEGVETLRAALSFKCSLKVLKISMIDMDDTGVTHLIPALGNSNLNELDISVNNCTDDSGKDLFNYLVNQENMIDNLNVAGNNFTDEILTDLVNAIQHNNCKLKKLDISENDFSESALKQIILACSSNTSLVQLNISKNGSKSMSYLRPGKDKSSELEELLKECQKLRDLKIII